MMSLMTCGVWYVPPSASVAIMFACSSTVSEAWPSAVPASSCMRLQAAPPCFMELTSTPKALAISVTLLGLPLGLYPATRCQRSA